MHLVQTLDKRKEAPIAISNAAPLSELDLHHRELYNSQVLIQYSTGLAMPGMVLAVKRDSSCTWSYVAVSPCCPVAVPLCVFEWNKDDADRKAVRRLPAHMLDLESDQLGTLFEQSHEQARW